MGAVRNRTWSAAWRVVTPGVLLLLPLSLLPAGGCEEADVPQVAEAGEGVEAPPVVPPAALGQVLQQRVARLSASLANLPPNAPAATTAGVTFEHAIEYFREAYESAPDGDARGRIRNLQAAARASAGEAEQSELRRSVDAGFAAAQEALVELTPAPPPPPRLLAAMERLQERVSVLNSSAGPEYDRATLLAAEALRDVLAAHAETLTPAPPAPAGAG